jgi:uncharacterized protein
MGAWGMGQRTTRTGRRFGLWTAAVGGLVAAVLTTAAHARPTCDTAADCADLSFRLSVPGTDAYDPALALRAAKIACHGGVETGCHNAGFALDGDTTGEQALWYQLACGGGYGGACANLGVLFKNARGVARDYQAAVALFGLACELGSGSGCNDWGYILTQGTVGPPDPALSEEAYRLACDKGHLLGCNNYAAAVEDHDMAYAIGLYRWTCEAGLGLACRNLSRGLRGQGDAEASRALLERGCTAGDGLSCLNLSELEEGAKRERLRARACELAHEPACTVSELRHGAGDHRPPPTPGGGRLPSVRERLAQACSRDDARACLRLSAANSAGVVTWDQVEARVLPSVAKGCRLGEPEACLVEGIYLARRPKGSAEHTRGLALLERACSQEMRHACTLLDRRPAPGSAAPDPVEAQ